MDTCRLCFVFSSRRRHTRFDCDWSSDVCSSDLAADRFPSRGYAELKAQMTGAAESIGHNIVEGAGSTTQKEFARFLGISIKSTMELEHQLQLAHDYGILPKEQWSALTAETVEIRKMIAAYRDRLLEDA